jgi:hypothetical protein
MSRLPKITNPKLPKEFNPCNFIFVKYLVGFMDDNCDNKVFVEHDYMCSGCYNVVVGGVLYLTDEGGYTQDRLYRARYVDFLEALEAAIALIKSSNRNSFIKPRKGK